jgi:hypothetical protein
MEPRKDLPPEKAALTPRDRVARVAKNRGGWMIHPPSFCARQRDARVGVGSDQPPYDETNHMASTKKVVTQPAKKPSDQTPSAAFQPKTRPLGILHSGDI